MIDQLSTKHPGYQGKPRLVAILASVALVYFALGKLGLMHPYVGRHITLLWLPSGIALAALLRWGFRCWPGIFMGALATTYTVDAHLLLDCGIALGNTLAPLFAAWLLNRMHFDSSLHRAHDIMLLVIAAAIGMLISAGGGVATLALFGVLPMQEIYAGLRSWWAGDFIGVLLAAPLLLNISRIRLQKLWGQRVEFLSWFVIMFAVCWSVFFLINDVSGESPPLAFLVLPVIVWSAMRFGMLGSSLGVLLPVSIASVATGLGLGPFHTDVIQQSLFLLWLYLATLVLVNLTVVALQAGRSRADEAAQQSEMRFRKLFERHNSIMLLIDPVSGQIVDANASASRFYGYPLGHLLKMNIAQINCLTPDEIAAELALAKAEHRNFFVFPHRLSRGEMRVVEVHASPIESAGNVLLFSIIHDITGRKEAEQAILEAKERIEIIFNTSPDAVLISRLADGCITDVNNAFANLSGYTKEETIGSTTIGLNLWVDLDDRLTFIDSLQSKGFCDSFEAQFRKKDGSRHTGILSAGITEIKGIPHIVSTTHDITESKRIQHQNESLLRRYQILLASSIDGIYVMDMRGDIVEVNDTFCNMLGYTRQEAGRLNISDWNVQWSREELLDRLKNFIGKSVRFETVQRRKDGTLINVEVSTAGVEIDGKNYFFASSRDITKRKLAERKTEVLARRHQALMKSALEGIHIMDMTGNIVEANDTFCQMLGYTCDEVIGLNVADWDAQWSRAELLERFRKLISMDGALFETTHRRKDGTLIDVEVSTTGAEIDGVPYLYASSRDIGGRKRVEQELRESERISRMLMENAADAVFVADPKTERWLYVNARFKSLMGYSEEELLAGNIFDMVTPSYRDIYRERFRNIIDSGGVSMREMQMNKKDGSRVPVEMNAITLPDGSLYGSCRDITERKMNEESQRIAAITFNTQEAIMITTPDAKILRVNQAFQEVTGYSVDEVVGQNPSMFKSGRHDAGYYKDMWSDLLSSGKWAGEVWDKRKNGEIYPKLLTITAAYDERHQVTHYIAVFRDISSNKKSEQEIHQLAFYDPLTALPNRRLLMDRLQQGLAVSARNLRYGALLFLDLDHFKTVNDTRGHATGDQLLIEAGRRLKSCVREGDSVARLGGDEFVVLLEELDSEVNEAANQTEIVAEKILHELGLPYVLDDFECHLTVSIGIGLFIDHHESAESLLQHADVAMYQAKSAGRNAIRFFDPQMQAALDARVVLEADLRHALNKQQFNLHYQVQVDRQQRALGAEVLLRWNHPEYGLISPEQFIPLAEESGLIVPIGLWVLKTACAQLVAWQNQARTRDLTLAVNVSARQLHQNDFVVQVRHVLQESGARPSQLKLELTESVVLENVEDTIAKMRELKLLGVSFSMDDFGTGYSSLQYLKRLPLDQIKIDQSFVRDIATDPNDAAIVQTIIAMTEALGLNVIAEGVETEQQLEFLDLRGCHAFQGYLFSKPVPIEQFEILLLQDLRTSRHSSALP
jgi:diguanylate cyclase (GGDEF)-like protein/PAS domain S-box-containing protein